MSSVSPTVGFVTALEIERGWVGSGVMVEVGGMGRIRAEEATTRVLERGATAVVSWGIAGGLDPDLEPGAVVIPEYVIDADHGRRYADPGWRGRLLAAIGHLGPISVGPILHADVVVSTPADKRDLHRRWEASAVDMESAGIAGVAEGSGIPWLIVRVVGDVADHELPKAVAELGDEKGRLRVGAVAGLIVRPQLWPALIALAKASSAAGRSMRRVWAVAGPDLALGLDGRNGRRTTITSSSNGGDDLG